MEKINSYEKPALSVDAPSVDGLAKVLLGARTRYGDNWEQIASVAIAHCGSEAAKLREELAEQCERTKAARHTAELYAQAEAEALKRLDAHAAEIARLKAHITELGRANAALADGTATVLVSQPAPEGLPEVGHKKLKLFCRQMIEPMEATAAAVLREHRSRGNKSWAQEMEGCVEVIFAPWRRVAQPQAEQSKEGSDNGQSE